MMQSQKDNHYGIKLTPSNGNDHLIVKEKAKQKNIKEVKEEIGRITWCYKKSQNLNLRMQGQT